MTTTTQLSALPTKLFIDGAFVDAHDGGTFETMAPSSGVAIATICSGTAVDIDLAVVAARRAFDAGVWSRLTPQARKERILALADLVEIHSEQLAYVDAIEAGKPIIDCEAGDLPDVVATFRWFAEAADKVYGRVAPSGSDHLALIVREPIGVVGTIVPWNFPLATLALKLAPALAAGNSIVVKPSELASLSALRLAELSIEAGIPPGVLNVVPGMGAEAGKALGLHPDVDVISFTGSTRVGRQLLTYSAESNLKKIVLELGGKSPQLVTESVRDELEAVAEDLVQAAFWNAGQNCTAGSRVVVDNLIKDDLINAMISAAKNLVIGDPLDRVTTLGPLIHEAALDRILTALDAATASGARIITGGKRLLFESGGAYLGPTIVDNVRSDSPLAREELFGPVVVIIGYDTEEEAISIANDTDYGLAATVHSRNIDQAIRMARAIHAGTVGVNGYSEGDQSTPFGGWKQSGFGGQDNGLEAFEQYTEVKTIWITTA